MLHNDGNKNHRPGLINSFLDIFSVKLYGPKQSLETYAPLVCKLTTYRLGLEVKELSINMTTLNGTSIYK